MRRIVVTAAVTAASLFGAVGVAQAGGTPPPTVTPPAPDQSLPAPEVPVAPDQDLPLAPDQGLPVPVPPVEVTTLPTANTFARALIIRRVRAIIGADHRERVRVTAADTSCLESPAEASLFGCVFTLRAASTDRRDYGHYARYSRKHGRHGNPAPVRRRVRNTGCLGALTIQGGVGVTPAAVIRFVRCARIPRTV